MDNTESMQEPGVLPTDQVLVRTMTEDDVEVVVRIDAAASGRRRPTYFGKLIEKSVKLADLSISLVAELDGQVVGFVVGTLYYGEFGVAEPSASIDVIGVDGRYRRKQVGQALMRQLRINLSALRITSLRTKSPGTILTCWRFSEAPASDPRTGSVWNGNWIPPRRWIDWRTGDAMQTMWTPAGRHRQVLCRVRPAPDRSAC